MPRRREDGTPSPETQRRQLTDMLVRGLRARERAYLVWDTRQRGLAVQVQPTGRMTWKVVYHHHGRARWYTLGPVGAIGLSDARKLSGRVMFRVAEGEDPQAERMAERGAGTFAELAERYRDEHAMRRNKSWRQADALVKKHLLPRWSKLRAADITRADVRAMRARLADTPIVANAVQMAASSIFRWAMGQDIVEVNPCSHVRLNETRSRERVLSEAEIASFWAALGDVHPTRGAALRLLLLTGQRPGEVRAMRTEHIEEGWWTLPGEPVPELGWPGTKNGQTHRVWLPVAARALIEEQDAVGWVFPGSRGGPIGGLDEAMREVCAVLGAERATPHDMRRTHGTMVTGLGFGREAMNRIQNHREGGIADVYDRHDYSRESQRIMEAVADRIVAIATGRRDDTVVVLRAK